MWTWIKIGMVSLISTQAIAQVEVVFTGNNGVLLRSGENKVLIDALWSHTDTFWTRLTSAADRTNLFTAQAPFDGVRWALTTHNHPDHYQFSAVNQFLTNSPGTQFVGPPQVVGGGLATNPQVVRVNPAFQTESTTLTSPGIEIEVFHLEHFDQFGNDFSRIQDFAYLVTLGGVKVLHLGDVDYIRDNFQAFDFPSRQIDAVIIPTFNTLLTTANRDLVIDLVGARQIIATHLRAGAALATDLRNTQALYPGATIFTVPFQSITLNPVPEPSSIVLAGFGLLALSLVARPAPRGATR